MGSTQSNTRSEVETIEKLYDKQMQRQIVLAEESFVVKQAIKQARLKEAVFWEYLAGGTVAITTLFYGMRTKNRMVIVPIIPIIMIIGYHTEQLTQAYADSLYKNAEQILQDPKQRSLIKPMGGAITLAELDERRKRWTTTNALNTELI